MARAEQAETDKHNTMRIGLIDIDYNGSYPNLPLMKLSAWHKRQGDTVEWYNPMGERYSRVYIAKVFSWSEDYQYPINADLVFYGGSGYAITMDKQSEIFSHEVAAQRQRKNWIYVEQLDEKIEHIYPDYFLYPKLTQDTAFGFLTRGCPRGCSFCHVAAKEGKRSVKVADLNEFWHGQKNIVLCDPNLLACREWKPLLQQLIDSGAQVDFNQGLDARLMTREKAEMLGVIKIKEIHFAWDRYDEGEQVIRGLRLYEQYAKNKPHSHNAIVFTIVNYDTTLEQDLERIYRLRDIGYWAYVCIYDKQHADPVYKRLQRWCNNRIIFGAEPRFENYMKQPTTASDVIELPNGKKLVQTTLDL